MSQKSGLAGTIEPELSCRGIWTTHWTGLFLWIAIGGGLLAACGFNASAAAADEMLDDSATADGQRRILERVH